MDTKNSPFDIKAATKDLNKMFHELLGSSGDMVNTLIKMQAMDKMVPASDRLSPDIYGVEKFFIDFFVNDEMRDDFPIVVREFLAHEFANIPEYEDLEYFDMDAGDDWPEALFNRFILNLMVNAVNSGSEYTKALILLLYKTYYKKEYKILKKFSSISADEILSLAEPENPNEFYLANLSRVLYITKLSGIQMRTDCSFIYAFLNDRADVMDEQPHFSFSSEIMEVYEDARKEIEERFDIDKLYKLDGRAEKFMRNALKWLGYSPDYVDWCDNTYNGIVDHLATTLAILKRTYPNKDKEYTAEELVIYSQIIRCASAATCNQDWMTDMLRKVTYGADGSIFYEDFPPLFHPEDVAVKGQKEQKPVASSAVKTALEPAKVEESVYSEKKILEELEVLRRKVHKLEADNSNLRIDLSEKRKVDEENRNIKAQMESSNRELAALRSYVYGLTESDEPVQPESVEKMKKEIAALRIIIIGGHTNWVSKLKKEFPNWDFINPEASGTTAVSIVNNADRVYFFTDTISHSKYYQFMNAIRENKIEFGYIHGVNIEKNIRDIYRDISEDA